jgi:hypothetical protein
VSKRVLTFQERVAVGKLKDKRDRLRYRISQLTDRALAKRFNVSARTINRE